MRITSTSNRSQSIEIMAEQMYKKMKIQAFFWIPTLVGMLFALGGMLYGMHQEERHNKKIEAKYVASFAIFSVITGIAIGIFAVKRAIR